MLRYTTDRARPGLVALYDIRPGNGAGPFLQPRSPHGAGSSKNHTTCKQDLSESDEQAANGRHDDDADKPERNVLRPEPNLTTRQHFRCQFNTSHGSAGTFKGKGSGFI